MIEQILYPVHKVSQAESPFTQISRIPPLIIYNNLQIKFESDQAKTLVFIMPTMFHRQSWPWPLTLWTKTDRVPPLIIHNLHVKFESDWTKPAVCIVPTRFLYTECQSRHCLDPVTKNKNGSSPHHPQLSCEVWKWLGKNLVHIMPTRFIHRMPKLTLTFYPAIQNQ